MRHFFKKYWVVLAAFALSFLLTIFISTEDAVIAEAIGDNNTYTATGLNDQFRIADSFIDIAAPSLDFEF